MLNICVALMVVKIEQTLCDSALSNSPSHDYTHSGDHNWYAQSKPKAHRGASRYINNELKYNNKSFFLSIVTLICFLLRSVGSYYPAGTVVLLLLQWSLQT